MGTWGFGIAQDDTVADVVDFVVERLKAGDSLEAATREARANFADLEADANQAPLLWLALAKAQWKYGQVEAEILRRVREDIAAERGLDRWREDPKDFARRRAALAKFLAQVESPNPKPSALPKLIVRKAPFRPGDCLSVLLPDHRYTAALVLREDNSNPELGLNLVASLDYDEAIPPGLAVFERREWLILGQGAWKNEPDVRWCLPSGFKKIRKRISVVGNIPVDSLDSMDQGYFVGWAWLGTQILNRRAHRESHPS